MYLSKFSRGDNSSITAIKFQRRYEGYKIDDFIVECQNVHNGQKSKLLAQVKRSINITKGDKEFPEVMSAAWSDFNNSEIFSPDNDCIALITGPLSKTDVQHVRPLLDWARHSAKADEFFQKVGTPTFSSDEKREKLAVFKYHLEQAIQGKNLEDEKVWQFLKRFYLIGYDFDATSGSNLSLIQSMLKMSIVETASSNDVWTKIVTTIQDFNPNAGTITIDTLPKEIRDDFKSGISITRCSSIDKLKEHGDLILKGIRAHIANTHVKRTIHVDKLSEEANNCNFIIVTGSRGSGKSAVVKEFVEIHCKTDSIFCLRTEDLNKSHLDEVFTAIGIQIHLSELSARFAMMPEKYLIIESLEKLLELDNRTAFCDLLEFIKESKEWTVVASCREYALQQVCSTYLQYQGVSHKVIKIEDFSEDEFNVLLTDNPKLSVIAANSKLNKLLRNPFLADMAIRVINSDTQPNVTDEISLKKAVWQSVICKESERTGGMPAKRANVFTEISVRRAKQMVYEIPEDGFAQDVVYKLEEDGLLCRNAEKKLVRPAHDVLEDWAIEEFIDKIYQANSTDHTKYFQLIGNEPSIIRAFRFWLHQKLNIAQDSTGVGNWCISVLDNITIPKHWQDEIIIAILSGQCTAHFLNILRGKLLENQGKLLKRFCFLMRLTCKISNTEAIQNIPDNKVKQYMSFMLYKTWGDCWVDVIRFLYENRDNINYKSLPEILAILEDYSNLININDEKFPEVTKEMGLLALFLLEKVKDDYRSEMQQRLLKIIIKAVPMIEEEFNNLLERDVFGKRHRDRPHYVEHLVDYILVSLDSIMLCKYYPDLVIRLAWQEWVLENDNSENPFGSSRMEVEEYFGLNHKYDLRGFNPASGLKGPFWTLLKWHETKGLDFIIKLCNYAAGEYAKSRLDGNGDYQVDIIFNDGTVHKQFCSGRLWGGYRGITVLPDILQSALSQT
ncbi:MAG: ATP-binding protein [Sedimentisphaerales bacterium]|nr:ATP-binding protein [Sedimentisphaerales bacterium]